MIFNLSTIILIVWFISLVGLITGIKLRRKAVWIPSVILFAVICAGIIWAWFDLH